MHRAPATALGLALLLGAGGAFAVVGEEVGWAFSDWDTDGDGGLTESEFAEGASRAGLFDAWDGDGDGILIEDELMTGLYRSWDRNRDDVIDAPEFEENAARMLAPIDYAGFEAWDRDRDGGLGQPEFRARAQAIGLYELYVPEGRRVITEQAFLAAIHDAADVDDDGMVSREEARWLRESVGRSAADGQAAS